MCAHAVCAAPDLDGEVAVQEVRVIQQLVPALQLEHLGAQAAASWLEPVAAVDGLQQHLMPLENQVYLLSVQPLSPELVRDVPPGCALHVTGMQRQAMHS